MTLRMVGLVVLFLVPAVQLTAEEAASPGPSGVVAPEAPAPAPAPGPDLQDRNQPPKPDIGNETGKQADTRESMCLIIESAARAQDLPLEFFARVIWQESRFQPDAVGPLTRSGRRAEGIAQFMPETAGERRLLDPFDPVQALPKSAEFLSELRGQFGSLGLAAAAYNAGPRRVRDWLDGRGPMPQETRAYVLAITGSSVEDWAIAVKTGKAPEAPPERKPEPTASSCRALMALLRRSPNPFVAQLEQRIKLGADRPWGVQLAAGFNRDRALT